MVVQIDSREQKNANIIDYFESVGQKYIVSKNITCLEDVCKWENKRGQVKPEILQKIMQTFATKYGVEFIFTTKNEAGLQILKLLTPQLTL